MIYHEDSSEFLSLSEDDFLKLEKTGFYDNKQLLFEKDEDADEGEDDSPYDIEREYYCFNLYREVEGEKLYSPILLSYNVYLDTAILECLFENFIDDFATELYVVCEGDNINSDAVKQWFIDSYEDEDSVNVTLVTYE